MRALTTIVVLLCLLGGIASAQLRLRHDTPAPGEADSDGPSWCPTACSSFKEGKRLRLEHSYGRYAPRAGFGGYADECRPRPLVTHGLGSSEWRVDLASPPTPETSTIPIEVMLRLEAQQ